MKHFLILFLLMFFQNIAFAQSVSTNQNCPSFSVQKSNEISGDNISFKVVFENNFNSSNLSYKWTADNGEIIRGEGTNVITLGGIENLGSLEVKVEIIGLPEGCLNTKSYPVIFCGLPIPEIIAEYGKVNISEEKLWLDKFAVELQNNAYAIGFITKSFPRNPSKISSYKDLQRILDYIESRGVEKDRIIFGVAYDKEEQSRLFVIPPGAEQPEFSGEVLNFLKLTEKLKSSKSKTKKSGN